MDRLKKQIAEKIQKMITDTDWNLIQPSDTLRRNESEKITDLETMISIRKIGGGRTFIVKVSELY